MAYVRIGLAALAVTGLLAAATPAQAQGVGVKAGPVFADFSTDIDDLNFDKRTGLQGGIFFGGNRPGAVGIMGEVNFIQKKAFDEILDEEIKISYLQVPVLLRINGGSQNFAVYGIAGPAVDIKISDEVGDIDISEGFEGLDVSIIGGAGVEISRFIVEGRYTWGLRKINKSFNDFSEIKTRSFAILFGFRFN